MKLIVLSLFPALLRVAFFPIRKINADGSTTTPCDNVDKWTCPDRIRGRGLYALNTCPGGDLSDDDMDHADEHDSFHRALKKKGGSKSKKMKCCPYGTSLLNAQTTKKECCAQSRRRLTLRADLEPAPWAHPNDTRAELLAANPGICKIADFAETDVVSTMIKTFDNDERFERCVGSAHEHLPCKTCFRLSLENCVEDECTIVADLLDQIRSLWPSKSVQRDYFYVQRYEPDCAPTLVHKDITENDMEKSATATQVFYLSNGSGSVYFPNVDNDSKDDGLTIEPERGTLLTWLNVHPDGSHNDAAWHGIQATPKDADIRYALTYRITMSDDELQENASTFE